jgi:hypothetical protein
MRSVAFLVIGTTVLSAPAFAQNSEAPKYVVVVALSQAGQVVDAPSLTMSPGSAAYAQVDGRYRIDTRLTKGAGQRLTLEATIARPEAEQWIVVARPMLILNEGGTCDSSIAWHRRGNDRTDHPTCTKSSNPISLSISAVV